MANLKSNIRVLSFCSSDVEDIIVKLENNSDELREATKSTVQKLQEAVNELREIKNYMEDEYEDKRD